MTEQEHSQIPVSRNGASPAAPVLAVRDLHKSYGSYEALKGISFEASTGDVVSLIGSSGSGKSTLLRCINFLETPNAGELAIDGEEIRFTGTGRTAKADLRRIRTIRARLGMVFQNFNLWSHMTILQNITAGPVHVLGMKRAEAEHEAEKLLHKVGLIDKRNAYPGQLSGGQQQRVAIARALAMQPSILLFDEPTSALDPERVTEVLNVMRQLAEEGRTMIIVTHEMAFAQDVSTKVLFLHQGRIEEEGPPAEIFHKPRSPRLQQFLSH